MWRWILLALATLWAIGVTLFIFGFHINEPKGVLTMTTGGRTYVGNPPALTLYERDGAIWEIALFLIGFVLVARIGGPSLSCRSSDHWARLAGHCRWLSVGPLLALRAHLWPSRDRDYRHSGDPRRTSNQGRDPYAGGVHLSHSFLSLEDSAADPKLDGLSQLCRRVRFVPAFGGTLRSFFLALDELKKATYF